VPLLSLRQLVYKTYFILTSALKFNRRIHRNRS